MRRVGLFLGVAPSAGGMFQYAQSLLAALSSLPTEHYSVKIAYIGAPWRNILANYPLFATELRAGKLGLILAMVMMAARVPGGVSRTITEWLNPLSRQLRGQQCDFWIFPAQDALAYQLSQPVLVSVHDLMHRYEPHFPEVEKGRRFDIREHRFRNLVSWSKGVLVDSDVGKGHVVESYGVSPTKVYPLPYVATPLMPDQCTDGDVARRYGLPRKFFFYPAQFWKHKNHAALISAAAKARELCPGVQLVFTGAKRHEYEVVRDHAAALGMLDSVTFAGYVPDVDLPAFYRLARAMIMPTFFGPTNIPPLEALQYGCPVAVSNIYAMPAQLGDAAVYFDPKSVPDMATTLQKLWLDDALCATLRERAAKQAAAWGQDQFNRRFREILDTVIEDRLSPKRTGESS